MSTSTYLFRELLGATRAKSALYFAGAGLLLFFFLAIVSSFFLLTPVALVNPDAEEPVKEIRVSLSPTLSSATIDAHYLELRERPEIESIRFRFAQEFDDTASGGVFVIIPSSDDSAATLIPELRAINGVTDVIEIPQERPMEDAQFSLAARIGLLCGLVLTIGGSFLLFRLGYGELLGTFSGEIRMLRLSGVSARNLSILVVGFGLLIGLLASILHFVVVYLVHLVVISRAQMWQILEAASSGMRILGIGFVGLILGALLGALMGLLGASLLHGRAFDPLP